MSQDKENQIIEEPEVNEDQQQAASDFGGYDRLVTLSPREHIRQRPGMYIGKLGDGSQNDDGVYVLIKEVIDNSIDEFNTGYAKPVIDIDVVDGAVTIRDYGRDYWTGTVYTTNRRVWEHDEEFKDYLRKIRCMAVDMETATIFSVGFHNEIPTGALLLVSDNPMVPEGVKTEESDKVVSKNFVGEHLRIGIDSLRQLINNGITVKHLKF